MRIWIINQYAQMPSEAGITRHYSLARPMLQRGHEVTIITADIHHVTRQSLLAPGEQWRLDSADGVGFLRLRTPPYQGNSPARVWNMWCFARQVRRSPLLRNLPPPDVVVGSSPHLFAAWAAERRASALRVPFVFEVRDLLPQSYVDSGQFSPHHPAVLGFSYLENHCYRRAARIVTLLPRASDYLAERGVPRERVVWIPNGVDLSLTPEPTRPPAQHPLVVVYAGAHGLSNGLETVLDAARLLQADGWGDRLLLRLIGDGPEKPRLQQQAQAAGLRNVSFAAPVPKDQIYQELCAADIGLLHLRPLAVFRWGISPNKIFDYMAAARPVVCAVTTEDDPVRRAGCGLSVNSNDPQALATALQQLALMTPEERWQLGLRGRRYVEQHHNFDDLSRHFEQVLQQAVEG